MSINSIISFLILGGIGGLMFFFVKRFKNQKEDTIIDNTKKYDSNREENKNTVEKQSLKEIADFFKKFRWILILTIIFVFANCTNTRHIVLVLTEPPSYPSVNPEYSEETQVLYFAKEDAKKIETFLLDMKDWREMVKNSIYDFKKQVEK